MEHGNFSNDIDAAIVELNSVWDEIGIENEYRLTCLNSMKQSLSDILSNTIRSEIEKKTSMEKEVNETWVCVKKLCSELHGNFKEPADDSMTLVEMHRYLVDQCEQLEEQKRQRLSDLLVLQDELRKLQEILGDPLDCESFHGEAADLSVARIDLFEVTIGEIHEEIKRRSDIVLQCSAAVVALWDELELSPRSELENTVATLGISHHIDHDKLVLNEDTLTQISELKSSLEEERSRRSTLMDNILLEVESLWNTMETPVAERDVILSSVLGRFSADAISVLKTERSRMAQLRKDNLAKFIKKARLELESLYNSCFYGSTQRNESKLLNDDNLSEDLLDAHEQEILRIKSLLKKHESLYKLVSQRKDLLAMNETMESEGPERLLVRNKGHDPKRALREEKTRAGMSRLPQLEAKLCTLAKRWEEEERTRFLIDGYPFDDKLAMDAEARLSLKQQREEDRKRQKALKLVEESYFGSQPRTPAAKKASTLARTTPSRTPLAGAIITASKRTVARTPTTGPTTARRMAFGSINGASQSPRTGLTSRIPNKTKVPKPKPVREPQCRENEEKVVVNSPDFTVGTFDDFRNGISEKSNMESSTFDF